MLKNSRHMSKKLDILSLFLKGYECSFSGREIAKVLGISPQTAWSVLQGLVKEQVLLLAKEGRNSRYRLNKKDIRTKLLLVMAETNTSKVFLENEELRQPLEKFLPFTETIIVFGSFAKGNEKESSDIDLIIIGAKKKEVLRKLRRIFPREINLEFVTWGTFETALREKNALALEIKKDHLIYGNVFKVVDIYCR